MDVAAYDPRTVEEVFRDYKGRRIGIIKALTTDAEEFFRNCDPGKDNLCLYGFPNETWEVNLPAEEVPPEIPEPALGINFARDGMPEKQWLAMVAVHSDSWLASVSYFFSARFAFDKNDRKRLFTLINDLPTIHEVVTGRANRKSPPRTINSKSKSNSNNSNSNSKLKGLEISTPRHLMPPKKKLKSESSSEHEAEEGLDEEKVVHRQKREIEEEGDGIDEHGDTLCGACGDNYVGDEFWICCDVCEKWFHGKCVKITPAKAESIKQYKCPACNNNKRPRPS